MSEKKKDSVCVCMNVDRKLEINNARVYIILRLPTTAEASACPIRLGRYLFVLFSVSWVSQILFRYLFYHNILSSCS